MSSLLFKSTREPSAQQQKLDPSKERHEKINKVREALGDLQAEMPCFLSDATILRFLRARNWSTAQAAKALKEAAQWRRQYQPEKIRWDDIVDSENEAKRAYVPDYLDKNGRTVFVTRPTMKFCLPGNVEGFNLKHLMDEEAVMGMSKTTGIALPGAVFEWILITSSPSTQNNLSERELPEITK